MVAMESIITLVVARWDSDDERNGGGKVARRYRRWEERVSNIEYFYLL